MGDGRRFVLVGPLQLTRNVCAWSPTPIPVSLTLKYGDDPLKDLAGELFDIRTTFDPGDASEVTLNLRGTTVTYNAVRKVLSLLGKEVTLTSVAGKVKVQILVDRASIEVFGNDGVVSMSSCFLPSPRDNRISLSVRGGPAKIALLEVCELVSAWKKATP